MNSSREPGDDLIEPEAFVTKLSQLGIEYFTGVPDSLLKDICAFVSDNVRPGNHVIAANEGAAVGLAMGYYLATDKIPIVYMQNSGLGNAINPVTSLADPDVYSIPMLMMIGLRGQPGVKDEPQHVKQGRITIDMLNTMEIPWHLMETDETKSLGRLEQAVKSVREHSRIEALIVPKGVFNKYVLKSETDNKFKFQREQVITKIVELSGPDDILVATTGMTGRELYEIREATNQGHHSDFLTVGGMGHASQIALGISQQKPNRKVICLDGDGAALMHMGSIGIIGSQAGPNYYHILINNGSHDSVGGQPTIGFSINFLKIAEGCGYKNIFAHDLADLDGKILNSFLSSTGPSLIEIKVNKGSRSDLGRPLTSPKENKKMFMEHLRSKP